MNNKARASIMGFIVIMLLVIGMFTGVFLYVSDSAQDSGIAVDPKYNGTYNKMIETRESIKEQTDEIQNKTLQITEAPVGFLTALNGFKVLGSTLLLFKGFASNAIDLINLVFLGTDVIPSWAMNLIVSGGIVTVLILFLAWWKGEQVSI